MVKQIKYQTGLGVILVLVFGISGCIESSFDLADESRIPVWLNVPEGLYRSDLDITLDYHTDGRAVFRLYRREGSRLLDEVTGVVRDGMPLERDGSTWPVGQMPDYPLYEVIIVDGNAGIIEHRKMEPVFYISDDPEIRQALGCSVTTGGGLDCTD